jgi:hypothetical protein
MPKVTIVFGLLLCGLSAIVLLLKAEFKLGTWLIPSGVGLPLIVLGLLAAIQPGARKHYMHAAVTLGLLAGWPLSKLHAHAERVAAYVCTQRGGTPPIPADLQIG